MRMSIVGKSVAIGAFGLMIGVSCPALAQQQQGVTDTEVVIGDIMPMSGPPALLGSAHNIGVRIAVAEINAKGGIGGRRIKLISEDDGYVVARTVQGVRKLIHNDKVFALASFSGSTQGQAALPLVKEAGLPTISTASFSEDLYKPVVKNVFAIGTLHPLVAEQITTTMNGLFRGKKWAIVTQDDEYGELTRAGFEKATKELKLSVVGNISYKKGQTDFSAEMLKIKQAGAEILFAGGLVSEDVAMAKELERLSYRIPMGVSYVARVPVMLKLIGPVADNTYTVDYVVGEESPQGKAFLERAKGLVSEDDVKRINRFTFTGYVGARVLLEAMTQCAQTLTWACVNGKLENMSNFDTGVTSPVSFSPQSHLSLQKLQLLKGSAATHTFSPIQ